ncbi:MAG: hypothetical protein EAZ70_03700 [Runella slithyformis]|nr:MAG: hypothetical protein EAY79_03335 [Runella slithyformis]TAE93893.1 MAG: hypothetical protein EAZ80_10915 [Runella slithyformis]TAF28924.1 MAG: hypothetical protein EAZ70_03700 [Runella slithyformis]TAF47977.1 MAG: hypothetical protein EAZ63_06545 [Runella slithyformis]TAF82463.1 MAG: hypothetical protein EAZ50_03875 [Runella slithyformis]
MAFNNVIESAVGLLFKIYNFEFSFLFFFQSAQSCPCARQKQPESNVCVNKRLLGAIFSKLGYFFVIFNQCRV